MSLSILTNTSANQVQANLLKSSNSVSTAEARLSSGLRINSAADDAAGYAISQGLTSQVNGLNQAGMNVSDATNMVQTALGSMNGIEQMLQRVRELAVQYNSGTQSTNGKADIQNEVDQLTSEVDRERTASSFNGNNLLNGTAGAAGTVTFQVGANTGDSLTASFGDVESATGMGVAGFTWANAQTPGSHVVDLSTTTLGNIDTAIQNISTMAANLGATQNRLAYTSDSISTSQQNLAAANSSITDVNMAQEMTTLTQHQILQQAGTAMLAQANQNPQLILKLLG